MTKIHTIGDSHCAFTFRGASDEDHILYPRDGNLLKVPLAIHFIGSRTMHSFGLRGCDSKYFEDLSEGDYLVFCFGEIDVRCHIHNQIHKESRGVEEVLETLCKNYLEKVSAICTEYKVNPVIFGITPPVKELTVDNYPSVGPFTDRVGYTKSMNQKLETKAKEQGMLYFDVFDEYALPDGTMNMKFSDNLMHINQNFNLLAKVKLCDLVWDHFQSLNKFS